MTTNSFIATLRIVLGKQSSSLFESTESAGHSKLSSTAAFLSLRFIKIQDLILYQALIVYSVMSKEFLPENTEANIRNSKNNSKLIKIS